MSIYSPKHLDRSVVATCLLRTAVAGVWLYQGLWNKLLSPTGRHATIVGSAPSALGASPETMLMILGAAEVVLAFWVLIGLGPRAAAVAQTLVLIAMNVGGLVWARGVIADPGGMIVQNIAFLALVWVVALRGTQPHKLHG
jgi:uncharacterized membrane protein YphA (DoxX/SURF4 family)